MGRTSAPKWTERVIDIDILLYDSIIMDTPSLTIPHPYMHLRNFVLVPCNEIMPDAVHPILHKNIGELLALCNDNLYVQLFHNE
jgi:2-amino-4-hydroxy-6-hydroxymethyldihydropteridine diphosphokinase